MTEAPAVRRGGRERESEARVRRGWTPAGMLTAVALAVVTLAIPVTTVVLLREAPYEQVHLGFPGWDVVLPTTVLRTSADASGMLTVGSLVTLLFLAPAPGRRGLLEPTFELRLLRGATGAWAASSCALVFFEAFDASGIPLSLIGRPGAFSTLYDAAYDPPAWTVTFLAALLMFLGTYVVRRWAGLVGMLWLATLAALAPVVVGQILVGRNHDVGSDVGMIQTIAVDMLFGAVVVAALLRGSGRLVPPSALRRLVVLGALTLPVIVITDLVLAWFKLVGTALVESLTGWQIVVRWLVLAVVVLAAAVAAAMFRAGRLREVHVRIVLLTATAAVATWVGTGVAMTRQPPPHYFVDTSISQIFLGFEVPNDPTPFVMLTNWRVNVLFLGFAVCAVTGYLVAVRVLHRRGDHWPAGRTVAWILGWLVVVLATSSGLGKYSAADFAAHMIVHMILNMLAPGLLVLGGVITLGLRAARPGDGTGLHGWLTRLLNWPVLRWIYNPLVVFAVFVGSYYGLYFTPVFGELMRYHWGHQLMNLHLFVVGYFYYSLIIGLDRPPRPLPHIGRLGYALAAMPFHAFFGVILMTSPTLVAETFYRYLDLPWADLAASQRLAGAVAWAGGEIPLLIVIVALGIQWARQDEKEASRKDRHLDTGLDEEFEAYNRMLRRLSERDAAGSRAGAPEGRGEL